MVRNYMTKRESFSIFSLVEGVEIRIWTNMRAKGKQNKRNFSKDRDLTTFARETAIL